MPNPPASATVGGAELVRPGARIEIEGVAVIPNKAA
jgi:enamine deaminase RidA (YjgF/YER057c/UK114 family)